MSQANFMLTNGGGVRRLAPGLDMIKTPRLVRNRVQSNIIAMIEGIQAFHAANAGCPIEATVEVA